MEARSVITMVLEGFKDLTRGLSEVSTDDVEDRSFGLATALILDEILQYEGERGRGWNRIDPIGFFESGYGAAAVNAEEMTAAEV